MSLRSLVFALCLASGLLACQSVPPVPEWQYYRLYLPPAAATPSSWRLSGEVRVLPLRAEGVYSERALIFSADGKRQLQQYHYQYWLYPPAQLIQDYLAAQWRQNGLAAAVLATERSSTAGWQISGRILRFERALPSQTARVELELWLEKNGQQRQRRTYSAEEPLRGSSIAAYVAATETALQRIADEFTRQTASLPLD